jgi:serine/threonine protein kinase
MGFHIGQVVCGRYEILGVLPPPAFGELYRAHSPELRTEVQLLSLGRALLPDRMSRESLLQRVGLSRGLRQPNLIWLYDVRLAEDDSVVVATQWAGADTLRSRIDKRKHERAGWPLTPDEAWGIVQQVAFAVVQLHRDAEVLGDLRADTLIVTPDGLKLFNHGVGCALPRDRFIEALERVGEDAFVAPEVRGGAAPTVRSDVYSLAALMHELVFGEPPSVTAPVLSPKWPTRPQLSEVLRRGLNEEPFERPLSVDALLREMQPTIAEPEQPMPAEQPVEKPSSQNENRTMIGEVRLPASKPVAPGGIDIEAAVARAKEAAASGLAPEVGGRKNEGVTRELEVDEVESLLGKNETRQINLNEIASLLQKSRDPSLEDKLPAKPAASAPKPQLFNQAPAEQAAVPVMEELRAPVVELRPEDKKTGMFEPMDQAAQFAGSAPPPLWEEVKSKIERRERGRRRPLVFIIIAVVVAALAGTGAWLFLTGRLAGILGQKPPPAPQKIEEPKEPPPKAEEPKEPPPKAEEPKAAVAEAGPCGANAVQLEGKQVCIDTYEFPGKGELPRVQVSFVEAAQLCGGRGARLCSESEWEHACRGPSNAAYPYGAAFVAGKCNSKGSGGKLMPSGSLAGCKSAAGAFDMSGNAAEWVMLESQMPAIKGGSALAGDPDSACDKKLEAKSLAGGPLVGFRCCRDLK